MVDECRKAICKNDTQLVIFFKLTWIFINDAMLLICWMHQQSNANEKYYLTL